MEINTNQGASEPRKHDSGVSNSEKERQVAVVPRVYNPEPKKDVTARPCAVIGPESVEHSYLRRDDHERTYNVGCSSTYYPPSYYPPRNISPRQSFQENMNRIVVPSSSELLNYHQVNDVSKSNSKYCEGPILIKSPHVDMLRAPYYAAPPVNYQRYPEYGGPRIQVIKSSDMLPRMPDPNSFLFPQTPNYPSKAYKKVNDLRYEPYPQSLQARYDYAYPYPDHVTPLSAIEKFNNVKRRLGQTPDYPLRYLSAHSEIQNVNYPAKTATSMPSRRQPVTTYYPGIPYTSQTESQAATQTKLYECLPKVPSSVPARRQSVVCHYSESSPHGPQTSQSKLYNYQSKVPPPTPVRRTSVVETSHGSQSDSYTANQSKLYNYQSKVTQFVPSRRPPLAPHLETPLVSQPESYTISQAKLYGYSVNDKRSEYNQNQRLEKSNQSYSQYNHNSYQESRLPSEFLENTTYAKNYTPLQSVHYPPASVPYSTSNPMPYQKPMDIPFHSRTLESDSMYYRYYQRPSQSSVQYNPLDNVPTQFSPNIISPADSSTSCNSVNTALPPQSLEDGGYVSQCSTSSGRSSDPNTANAIKENLLEVRGKLEQSNVNKAKSSMVNADKDPKDNSKKTSLDLRQYYSSWVEEFDETSKSQEAANSLENANVGESSSGNANASSAHLQNGYSSEKVDGSQLSRVTGCTENINALYQPHLVNSVARTNISTPSYSVHSKGKSNISLPQYLLERHNTPLNSYRMHHFDNPNMAVPHYNVPSMEKSQTPLSLQNYSSVKSYMPVAPYFLYPDKLNLPSSEHISNKEKANTTTQVHNAQPAQKDNLTSVPYGSNSKSNSCVYTNSSYSGERNIPNGDYSVTNRNLNSGLSDSTYNSQEKINPRRHKNNVKSVNKPNNTPNVKELMPVINQEMKAAEKSPDLNDLIDVEESISQSVIHKDVSSNYGATPIEMKIEIAPGYSATHLEKSVSKTDAECKNNLSQDHPIRDHSSNHPNTEKTTVNFTNTNSDSKTKEGVMNRSQFKSQHGKVGAVSQYKTSTHSGSENQKIGDLSLLHSQNVPNQSAKVTYSEHVPFFHSESLYSNCLYNQPLPVHTAPFTINTSVISTPTNSSETSQKFASNSNVVQHESHMYNPRRQNYENVASHKENNIIHPPSNYIREEAMKTKPVHETVLKYVGGNNTQNNLVDLSNTKMRTTFPKIPDNNAAIESNNVNTLVKKSELVNKNSENNYNTVNMQFKNSGLVVNNSTCANIGDLLNSTTSHNESIEARYQLCEERLSDNCLERTKSSNVPDKLDKEHNFAIRHNNSIKHNIDKIILPNNNTDVANSAYRYDSLPYTDGFDPQMVATDLSMVKNYDNVDNFDYANKNSKPVLEIATVDTPLRTPEIVGERLEEMGLSSIMSKHDVIKDTPKSDSLEESDPNLTEACVDGKGSDLNIRVESGLTEVLENDNNLVALLNEPEKRMEINTTLLDNEVLIHIPEKAQSDDNFDSDVKAEDMEIEYEMNEIISESGISLSVNDKPSHLDNELDVAQNETAVESNIVKEPNKKHDENASNSESVTIIETEDMSVEKLNTCELDKEIENTDMADLELTGKSQENNADKSNENTVDQDNESGSLDLTKDSENDRNESGETSDFEEEIDIVTVDTNNEDYVHSNEPIVKEETINPIDHLDSEFNHTQDDGVVKTSINDISQNHSSGSISSDLQLKNTEHSKTNILMPTCDNDIVESIDVDNESSSCVELKLEDTERLQKDDVDNDCIIIEDSENNNKPSSDESDEVNDLGNEKEPIKNESIETNDSVNEKASLDCESDEIEDPVCESESVDNKLVETEDPECKSELTKYSENEFMTIEDSDHEKEPNEDKLEEIQTCVNIVSNDCVKGPDENNESISTTVDLSQNSDDEIQIIEDDCFESAPLCPTDINDNTVSDEVIIENDEDHDDRENDHDIDDAYVHGDSINEDEQLKQLEVEDGVPNNHIEPEYQSFQLTIDSNLIPEGENVLYYSIESPSSVKSTENNGDKYYLHVDSLEGISEGGTITMIPCQEQESQPQNAVENSDHFQEDTCLPWIEDVACMETVVSEEVICDEAEESHDVYTPEPLWGPNSISQDECIDDDMSLTPQSSTQCTINEQSKDSDYEGLINNDPILEESQNNISDNEFENLSLAMSTEDHSSTNFSELFLKTAINLESPKCQYDEDLINVLMDDPITSNTGQGVESLHSAKKVQNSKEGQKYNTVLCAENKHQNDSPIQYVANKTMKPLDSSETSDDSDSSVSSESDSSDEDSSGKDVQKVSDSTSPSKCVTKGAQKYIPTLDISYYNLKCQLPLPEEKLQHFKMLNMKRSVNSNEKGDGPEELKEKPSNPLEQTEKAINFSGSMEKSSNLQDVRKKGNHLLTDKANALLVPVEETSDVLGEMDKDGRMSGLAKSSTLQGPQKTTQIKSPNTTRKKDVSHATTSNMKSSSSKKSKPVIPKVIIKKNEDGPSYSSKIDVKAPTLPVLSNEIDNILNTNKSIEKAKGSQVKNVKKPPNKRVTQTDCVQKNTSKKTTNNDEASPITKSNNINVELNRFNVDPTTENCRTSTASDCNANKNKNDGNQNNSITRTVSKEHSPKAINKSKPGAGNETDKTPAKICNGRQACSFEDAIDTDKNLFLIKPLRVYSRSKVPKGSTNAQSGNANKVSAEPNPEKLQKNISGTPVQEHSSCNTKSNVENSTNMPRKRIITRRMSLAPSVTKFDPKSDTEKTTRKTTKKSTNKKSLARAKSDDDVVKVRRKNKHKKKLVLADSDESNHAMTLEPLEPRGTKRAKMAKRRMTISYQSINLEGDDNNNATNSRKPEAGKVNNRRMTITYDSPSRDTSSSNGSETSEVITQSGTKNSYNLSGLLMNNCDNNSYKPYSTNPNCGNSSFSNSFKDYDRASSEKTNTSASRQKLIVHDEESRNCDEMFLSGRKSRTKRKTLPINDPGYVPAVKENSATKSKNNPGKISNRRMTDTNDFQSYEPTRKHQCQRQRSPSSSESSSKNVGSDTYIPSFKSNILEQIEKIKTSLQQSNSPLIHTCDPEPYIPQKVIREEIFEAGNGNLQRFTTSIDSFVIRNNDKSKKREFHRRQTISYDCNAFPPTQRDSGVADGQHEELNVNNVSQSNDTVLTESLQELNYVPSNKISHRRLTISYDVHSDASVSTNIDKNLSHQRTVICFDDFIENAKNKTAKKKQKVKKKDFKSSRETRKSKKWQPFVSLIKDRAVEKLVTVKRGTVSFVDSAPELPKESKDCESARVDESNVPSTSSSQKKGNCNSKKIKDPRISASQKSKLSDL